MTGCYAEKIENALKSYIADHPGTLTANRLSPPSSKTGSQVMATCHRGKRGCVPRILTLQTTIEACRSLSDVASFVVKDILHPQP